MFASNAVWGWRFPKAIEENPHGEVVAIGPGTISVMIFLQAQLEARLPRIFTIVAEMKADAKRTPGPQLLFFSIATGTGTDSAVAVSDSQPSRRASTASTHSLLGAAIARATRTAMAQRSRVKAVAERSMNLPHLTLPCEEDAIRALDTPHGGGVWLPNGKLGAVEDFSANIWPYPLDPFALQSCFSALNVYPDADYRGLVSAAAGYYGVEEKQVFPANGSTEALYLAMLTLKPNRVAIFEPTFSEYARAAQWATSGKVEIVRILADDQDDFRPALPVPAADVAIICNPNNPTGVFVPRIELLAWIQKCAKGGPFVIVDEAFVEFVEDQQPSLARAFMDNPNLLILRSMTKYFGIPGVRLGFALGPVSVIEKIWANRIPWSINTVAQQLGTHLTCNSSAQESKIAETVARERVFLTNGLQELGWKVLPSAVNFLLCKLPAGLSNRKLLPQLLREGFLLRDAANFYGLDDSYVRCAVKVHSAHQSLLKAIAKCM